MLSGKTVKHIVLEVIQFACVCVPVFVIMQRFASLMYDIRGGDHTAYWLVVATSIAYVTTVSLLIWVPLKYLTLTSKGFIAEITSWRPPALAYVIFSLLPCFGVLLAGSKVQVDGGYRFDHFTELAVSLVIISLIMFDITERIRPFCLTGQASEPDFELPAPVLTHLERQVATVSLQLDEDRGSNGSVYQVQTNNGSMGGSWRDSERYIPRESSNSYLYSTSSRYPDSGYLSLLWSRDPRVAVFVQSFIFWLDTVEMLRVAEVPFVFYSNWVFPIYILTYLAMLRLVLSPNNQLLPFLGVVLQDLPFLVIRICLVAVFGYVTPLLYLMKNLIVCLSHVYFIFMTHLKIFRRSSMF